MITSISNPKLKNVRELMEKSRERKKAGAFVIEGIRMFNETPDNLLLDTFVSESFRRGNPGIPGEVVSDGIFKRLSDTRTPQGIMAVVKKPDHDEERIFDADKGLYLVLEGIQDPGNLGTMVRTGEAAGVSGIIMDRDTADLYSPKVVRATMGSVYRVPCIHTEDLPSMVKGMKEKGIRIYAADLKGEMFFHETDYAEKTAFLIGNEGAGLSEEMRSLADTRIKIPMEGKTESLNAAVAAAILMYSYKVDKAAK